MKKIDFSNISPIEVKENGIHEAVKSHDTAEKIDLKSFYQFSDISTLKQRHLYLEFLHI